MHRNRRLLIVNYAMDAQDALLSHQLEAVQALAVNFESVIVLTGKVGSFQPIPNVKVFTTNWIPGKKITSLCKLAFKSLPIIVGGKFDSVFFHMTDLQCAILSPIIRIRRRHQVLWYAHKKKSPFLWWSSLWVEYIATSTEGSCPLKGKKVIPIGQAIDHVRFGRISIERLDFNKLIHVGRFDKSKKIEILIQQAIKLRKEFKDISLNLVGSPTNHEARIWAKNIRREFHVEVEKGWLNFSDSIYRAKVPKTLSNHGCFFHAYMGSLDKTLIESTMMGLPVVTTNPEYLKIFGTWSSFSSPDLVDEYRALRGLTKRELEIILKKKRRVAIAGHSLKKWTEQLSVLLG